MRKLFLLACMLVTLATQAQHTITREQTYGVTDASVTSYSWATITDLASATVDTITLRPNTSMKRYTYAVVDSASLKLVTASCYKGDEVELYITNPTIANNFVYLYGNWIVSTGTAKISLTTGTKSYMRFVFDGVNYVESSRRLNY